MGSYGHTDGTVEHYVPAGAKWKNVAPGERLKPCQKCGAVQDGFTGPVFWYAGMDDENSGYGISCKQCGCTLEKKYKTPQEAVDAWNKR